MKMLRSAALAALAFCLFASPALHAQAWSPENRSRWEIGVSGGAALYFGDLTPSKRSFFQEATPQGGAFARFHIGEGFSLRGSLCVAKLSADDAKYSSPEWRQHRNFAFSTPLYEASVMLEYDLLRTFREETGNKWGVYAFLGLGLAYTDPKRNFSQIDIPYFGNTDKAVSGLDADQSSSAAHLALVAPIGLGISYDLTHHFTLFTEGSIRHGFDDKIDGFSSSVSSGRNDAYSFFSLGLSFRPARSRWWK